MSTPAPRLKHKSLLLKTVMTGNLGLQIQPRSELLAEQGDHPEPAHGTLEIGRRGRYETVPGAIPINTAFRRVPGIGDFHVLDFRRPTTALAKRQT